MSLFGYHKHHLDDPLEGASPAEIELYYLLTHLIKITEQNHMAISAEVQAVLDQIKTNTSLAQSVDAGIKLMNTQITDLQTQIAALQAGTVLDADDKAALVQAAADLAATNTSLQGDIPASTTTTATGASGATSATGATSA